MSQDDCSVRLDNVSLVYELYYDRSNTLKELVVNFVKRRRYVHKRMENLYALKNITLGIRNGQRLGIIGLNGAGKSTLLKVISRLLTPTSGEIEIQGTVQPLIEMGAGFNFDCSGRENIYLNGAMLGFSKKTIKESEEEVIRFSDLHDFIDIPVKYYSSGMILRLAFSIATLVRPEILLLDEMISAGDIEFVRKAKDRIDQLLRKAKILILVSHDLPLIQSLTTRVIVLDRGEIVFEGDPRGAIEFYYELASKNLETQKDHSLVPAQASESQQAAAGGEPSPEEPIRIRAVSHLSNGRNPELIIPNDTVTYVVQFKTTALFEKFFINLVIMDRMGVWVAHLRNDAFEITFNDFAPGAYLLELSVHAIPFRTGHYTYFFRLVATSSSGEVLHICDSDQCKFDIGGDKLEHTLIGSTWNLTNDIK